VKILYIDPVVHSPVSANYKYYDGIFDSLADVFLYRGIPQDMQALIDNIDFVPDVVVFGLGWFNHGFYGEIKNINLPSVCILFKPQNNLKEKLSFCKTNNIERILTPIPRHEEYEASTGIQTKLFTYGFDPMVFLKRGSEKEYDIGFSGALHQSKHYPRGSFVCDDIRSRIFDKLNNISDVKVFWSASDDRPARIPNYEEYAKLIDKSKMWIATQAAFGDITPRFFEILGTGTLLFCQEAPDEYSEILKDGVNCIQFKSDLSDFEEKLKYCLENPEKVKEITDNAYRYFHGNYTWKNKAQELIEICEELL